MGWPLNTGHVKMVVTLVEDLFYFKRCWKIFHIKNPKGYTIEWMLLLLYSVLKDTSKFSSGPWALYRLSYLWYTVTGALVTMSVALFVSIFTPARVEKLDPMLVAPFVRKYLKNFEATELCQIQVLVKFL